MGFPYLGQPVLFGEPLGMQSGAEETLAGYLAGLANTRVWLKLDETSIASGNVADNAMYTGGVGAELLTNPSFDSGGTGWTETLNGGSSDYTGGQAAITAPGGNLAAISQAVATLGDTYDIVADIDSLTGNAQVGIAVSGADMIQYSTPGVKNSKAVALSTSFFLRTASASGVVTWNEASVKKSGEYDGRYVGPTLSGDTFMGQPCPTFDGVNDYVQLEHNRLETTFNPDLGSFVLAIKLSQANWENATQYNFITIGVDGNNRFQLYKNAANTLRFHVAIAGNVLVADYTVVSADYGKWLAPFCTWDKANNRIGLHVKSSSATNTFPSGTWTISALTNTFCRVGIVSSSNPVAGSIASLINVDSELTAGEIGMIYDLMRAGEPDMS